MSCFPCTSQCIIIYFVLRSLLSVKANHEITIQILESLVYYVFAQFSRNKTTPFPQTHSIQIQKYFWKSVDTFSLNEKKMYSAMELKRRYYHSFYTSRHLQHGLQYSDESHHLPLQLMKWSRILMWNLGLAVWDLVSCIDVKDRIARFEKSQVGASMGCL